MFTKQELMEKKKTEIMEIAEELGINRYKGKNALTKGSLINSILDVAGKKVKNQDVDKNDNQVNNIPNDINDKDLQQNRDAKERYLNTAEIGFLVAFKIETGRVKSAKIVNRSTSGRKLKVVTAYGMEYVIPYEDVLWIKTGTRWPKGVYMLLKGIPQKEVS